MNEEYRPEGGAPVSEPAAPAKRRGGRPKGSKNNPKVQTATHVADESDSYGSWEQEELQQEAVAQHTRQGEATAYTPPERERLTRQDETRRQRRRRADTDDTTANMKLHVPEHLKKSGYVYRWANDTQGGRVQELYNQDWDPVEDPRIRSTGEGTTVKRPVGTAKEGGGMNAVLMEKPKELHQEDRNRKWRKLAELEDSMRRGPLPSSEGLQPDVAYTPSGHRNVIGRSS